MNAGLDPKTKEDILRLIGKISPQARIFVNEAFHENKVTVFYYDQSIDNQGVFCIAETDDCSIAYYSFLYGPKNECYKDLIWFKIKPFIDAVNEKEICFNIYGKNIEAIEFVQSLGFKVDMEGYHLVYNRQEAPVVSQTDLIEKQYDDSMLEDLVDLFDKAYFQLNKDNGWRTDWYYRNSQAFQASLLEKIKNDEFRSFWIDGHLVGAYIVNGNYIQDIVVSPEYQNRGYGSLILAHCIRHMMLSKHLKQVYLRIAKSNVRAKQLYERNDFGEMACFAEHTF